MRPAVRTPPSLLLLLQPCLDFLRLRLAHSRGGFRQHLHEPVNLLRRKGMPDVAPVRFVWLRPFRINDQLTLRVHKGVKWKPGISAAKFFHDGDPARVFEMFVLLRFVNHQLHLDEIAIENGLDLFMLDKLIEPLAPPSPGGAEIDKNRFALLRRLRACFAEQLIRARRCRRR